jgi:hypothetical protein
LLDLDFSTRYEEIRELLPDFDWTNLPEEREVQNKKRDPK